MAEHVFLHQRLKVDDFSSILRARFLGHTRRRRKQGIRVDVLFPVKWLACYRIPQERNESFLRFRFLCFSFEIPSIQTGPKQRPYIQCAVQ
jgi:hypothetical protein